MAYKIAAIYDETGFTIDKIAVKSSKSSDSNEINQTDFYEALLNYPSGTIYEHAFLYKSDYDVSIQFLIDIAKSMISNISGSPDVDITRKAPKPNIENLMSLLRRVPYVIGCEFVNLNWIEQVYLDIAAVFNTEFTTFDGDLDQYFKSKNPELNAAGKVFFHLVESNDEKYPFAFLATYSEGENENIKHVPLKNALETNNKENLQDKLLALLSAVSRAADKSEFLSELIESGELFSPLRFKTKEAYTFLMETPIYEESGVVCRIPNFWKNKPGARLKANVGSKEPAVLGLDALMAFSPSIYLGDEEFTKAEIEQLLAESRGLAFLKGKWVEVDPEKLQALLKAFDEIEGKELSLAEALRMQSGFMSFGEDDTTDEIEVTNGEWLNELKSKMINPSEIKKQRVNKSFQATLRKYQNVGFNWLYFMIKSNFGALLADDMGLGKTVQILALFDLLRKDKIKSLLIIPASLVANWKKEAERFAPMLKIKILHGTEKEFSESAIEEADLFITTYGMVKRIEQLNSVTWDLIVLDEAQAIKNHSNKQTTAVKALNAKSKIAMTGTPVENRLSDLWSIFDFLNKGLLGSQKEFIQFTKGLKDDKLGYEKLRNVVSPFILRRLKTDKTIISDLPDKAEIKQYTTLTKKQIVLYNQLVKELEQAMKITDMSGIQRKGIILTSIMKFKQICNHPDQYLGNKEFLAKYSGKFEALSNICETIRDKRERMLIFTQFKEMTQPIADFLTEIFEREGLILHGGTTVKKRGELVERFNSTEYVPFMVLSLKAGGVGLNLTSANHVVHFDRWWNPAIENQATDRAFRIGQQKNVCVHKFVTTGTIEEKIDLIIEEKQKLAGDVIGAKSGENWITEMNNEELFNLLKLGVN
ncbi:MAG: DEAD/DEAH box helicase [Defluviitaleaceae bacterium]|nr:DEAD/DEAH box helicase [Defluviitaleaceae bacterium]